MTIRSDEISVVVQGAIDKKYTHRCLNSVRKVLPGSEIVLSTWEKSDTEGLHADKYVYSKDPGGMRDGDKIDNVNRQIVSTKAGIGEASRRYILKIRSDVELLKDAFLGYWDYLPDRESEYCYFAHKIIVSTMFSKRCLDQHTAIPVLFHLSDWFQFGLYEDLKKLWDIAPVDYRKYWKVNIAEVPLKIAGTWEANQYVPESYIFYSALKKKYERLLYRGLDDYNSENIEFSESIFLNNTVMDEPLKLGFIINKEPYRGYIRNLRRFLRNQPLCMYTFEYFADLYERKFNG